MTYRSELKEQVNQALAAGKLHQWQPQEQIKGNQFQMKQNDFPSVPPPSLAPVTTWNQTTTRMTKERKY